MLLAIITDVNMLEIFHQHLAEPLKGWAQIISAVISAIAARRQQSENRKAAERANAFTAEQSATAHQRQVKDLAAAGLNPILSAGGSGASSAVGAMQAPAVNEAEGALSSAKSFSLLKQALENQKLEGDKLEAERAAIKQRQMLDATQTQVLAGQREQAFVDADYYASPYGRATRYIENARRAVGALGVAAPVLDIKRQRDQQGRWTRDGGFYDPPKFRSPHGSGRVHSGTRDDPMRDLSR